MANPQGRPRQEPNAIIIDRNSQLRIRKNELAVYLDCEPGHIGGLERQGIIPRSNSAKMFNLRDVVSSYFRHMRKNRRATASVESPTDTYAKARTQKTQAQADLAEMKKRQIAGELVLLEDAIKQNIDIVNVAKTRLLAIPQKCAARILTCSSPIEAEQVMTKEIYDALDELSRLSVVRSPSRAIAEGDDEGVSSSEEDDGEPVGRRRKKAVA